MQIKNSSKNKIRLGLPKGSLNTIGRGNTYKIFKEAGYDIVGYEPGKESDKSLSIRNDPEIELYLSRPQSSPNELVLGMLDIAIVGSDWVLEETGGNNLQIIADLDYGRTRGVFAIDEKSSYSSLEEFVDGEARKGIVCFSEYVNIASNAISSTDSYKIIYDGFLPKKRLRGITVGENENVVVNMSDGVTEGYIKKGANLIFDNTKSGSTLKEYGLKEIAEAFQSSARLYGRSDLGNDYWKMKKAYDIASRLVLASRKIGMRDRYDTLPRPLDKNSPEMVDYGAKYIVRAFFEKMRGL